MKFSIITSIMKGVWLIPFLASLVCYSAEGSTNETTSSSRNGPTSAERKTQARQFYFSTTSLPWFNPDAAMGNPMRGLIGSPFYEHPPLPDAVPSTLEFFYVGLDSLLLENPAKVGMNKAFDWSTIETILTGSAERARHAIIRVYIHFPGKELRIPKYLVDDGVPLIWYKNNDVSPYYGDWKLMEALRYFIQTFGQQYDGDKRIYCIQVGLIGFWGEFHTFGYEYLLPQSSLEQVISWYSKAFTKTKLQLREPFQSAHALGFGKHDDSFGYSTLDGPDNGGVKQEWFFWPEVVTLKQENFWKVAPMGGEVRPELQASIFQSWYAKGTEKKQDFMRCVEVTHATFMFHYRAFNKNVTLSATELKNSRYAHARMGYNFRISKVAAALSLYHAGKIDVDVTIDQMGVAPFYYPLNLVIHCPGEWPYAIEGVEQVISEGDSKVFTFWGISPKQSCLDQISFTLDSPYGYDERPIKFAQGNDGIVKLKIPTPPNSPVSPVANPIPPSVNFPVPVPVPAVKPLPAKGPVSTRFKGFSLFDAKNPNARYLRPIQEGDTIDLKVVGDSLSIQVDLWWSSPKIVFRWGTDNLWTELLPPYAMWGNDGNRFNAVPYLATPGWKTMSVQIFEGEQEVDFIWINFQITRSSW
jgi:hypothetical protein